jgi:phenylacetate-CoA ligase
MIIDDRARERHPLISERGLRMLERLREHPDAPRFNHETGDRLRPDDLPILERLREAIATQRGPLAIGPPPPTILSRVAAWRHDVPRFRAKVPPDIDLEREWERVPTMSRADLAVAPWELVPDGEPIDRLVIYRTAGTTGHPITVPHHPLAIRCYEPLVEHALARHGVRAEFRDDEVACLLVGAQIRTYTYAALLHAWNGAGFAKLNLRQTEWPREGSQQRYFADMAPRLLTGDPISFAEVLKIDLPASPLAIITTSVAMSPLLRERLTARYRAPVIDWYSLVETGPIGYRCPRGTAYHLLPPDLFIEALRQDGSVCAEGERGEITVTGGRNPFAPLLRYRTGDWGRIDRAACECGDPMPRIVDLEGRSPVLLRSSDGTPVSTVDISRILREHPLLLHEFTQHKDRTCELVLRALPNRMPNVEQIEADLRRVLGTLPLTIRADETLGERIEGKVMAYRSELMVED